MICQNVCNLNIPRENQRHLLKLGKKPIHDKKEVAENIKTCHDKLSVTGNKDNGK